MSATLPSIPFADPVALTEALVRVDSRNPTLVPNAPGEEPAARLLAEVLRGWGCRVEVVEVVAGRPNVVARIGGRAGNVPARSLMFNGHLDVVGVEGMVHPAFDPLRRDGRLYGRGSADMKGGVAAMCAAAVRAAAQGLDGEIVIAGVCDEEYASIGTSALIASGVRADAAIVTEPTRLAICPAHRGFAWLEITVHGRAAHGSRWDLGVDAIRLAALIMAELDLHEHTTLTRHEHPLLGRASLHASTIEGGTGMSTYPDRCVLRVERRTLPGETGATAEAEVRAAIERVRARRPELRADVTMFGAQAPSDVATDAPVIRAIGAAIAGDGGEVRIEGLSAWTDASLLNAAGIPAICYGPGDIMLAHAAEEWVPEDEIVRAAAVLERFALAWCNGQPTDGAP